MHRQPLTSGGTPDSLHACMRMRVCVCVCADGRRQKQIAGTATVVCDTPAAASQALAQQLKASICPQGRAPRHLYLSRSSSSMHTHKPIIHAARPRPSHAPHACVRALRCTYTHKLKSVCSNAHAYAETSEYTYKPAVTPAAKPRHADATLAYKRDDIGKHTFRGSSCMRAMYLHTS